MQYPQDVQSLERFLLNFCVAGGFPDPLPYAKFQHYRYTMWGKKLHHFYYCNDFVNQHYMLVLL